MSSLALSTDNIISLTKLESAVRREYGQRYALSEERSMLSLLKLAGESSNQTIMLAFFQFLEGLSDTEKEKLIYRGVPIRAEVMADSAPAPTVSTPMASAKSSNFASSSHSELKALPEGVKKVVYRGQVIYKKNGKVIDETEALQPSSSALQGEGSDAKVAPTKIKSKRIYRGKVVED